MVRAERMRGRRRGSFVRSPRAGSPRVATSTLSEPLIKLLPIATVPSPANRQSRHAAGRRSCWSCLTVRRTASAHDSFVPWKCWGSSARPRPTACSIASPMASPARCSRVRPGWACGDSSRSRRVGRAVAGPTLRLRKRRKIEQGAQGRTCLRVRVLRDSSAGNQSRGAGCPPRCFGPLPC